MRKRNAILLFSFLTAAVMAFGAVAIINTTRLKSLEYTMRASNERAFSSLVSDMIELRNALVKSGYIADPSLQCALSTEIFGCALKAQRSMSELPYSSDQIEQAAGFLSKVGDYALAMSKKTGKGEAITEDERALMTQLSETASVLAGNLADLQMQLGNGTMVMDTLYTGKSTLGENLPLMSDSISDMETEFPELPTLIYDGPFSDSVRNDKPLYLEGMKEVDELQAKQIAAQLLQIDESALGPEGECGGDVPCWCYRATMSGGEYRVSITKQGGVLYSVLSSRSVGEGNYSTEDGLEIAANLLKQMGVEDMQPSYYIQQNGVLTVNFEYVQDNVRCYSDLIKVGIAMDNGILQSYDASGYIHAHREREWPSDILSSEEAADVLGESLRIKGSRLTLIPLDGGDELLCYEFACDLGSENNCLIYVDALKGTEERILLLIEDENGTLTV